MAITSPFSKLRSQIDSSLDSTISQLSTLRTSNDAINDPIDENTMFGLVEDVVARLNGEERYKELIRLSLERKLEDTLIKIAERTGDEEPRLLFDWLDLIQSFSEKGHTDTVNPLSTISTLLEIRTISQCQRIWPYIESRSARLTKGMVSGRGKGLILLKMLNELLKRLPRSKQEHVIFSGRILVFLSSVFPLSEKSGVNLRGNFNVGKKTLFDEDLKEEHPLEDDQKDEEEVKKKEEEVEERKEEEEGEEGEEKESKTEKNKQKSIESFYPIFWSLQRIFTDPNSLLSIATPAKTPHAFETLQEQLTVTLNIFADETIKEKQLAGAASTSKLSNSIELDEDNLENYFFPRFLTSRNLLKLELADPAFRRQILVQFLILFQYLLSLTPEERTRAQAKTVTNSFMLGTVEVQPAHEKWLRELRTRTVKELDSMINGKSFREAIELVLKREQHWITWKLQSCKPFELSPLAASDVSKTARSKLNVLSRRPKNYPYKLGNDTLSRLWMSNLTSLEGYEPELPSSDFDGLLREWMLCGKAVEQKELATSAAEGDEEKKDELTEELEQLRVRQQALHWRATRAASLEYLRFFRAIGAGDLAKLEAAIENSRNPPERTSEEAEMEVEKAVNGDVSAVEQMPEETAIEEEISGAAAVAGEGVQMIEDETEADDADPPLETNGITTPEPKLRRQVLIETEDEASITGSPKRARTIESDDIEGEVAASEAREEKKARLSQDVEL